MEEVNPKWLKMYYVKSIPASIGPLATTATRRLSMSLIIAANKRATPKKQTAKRSSPKYKRARRAALSEKAALVLLCL
jgi:hypothetical protein